MHVDCARLVFSPACACSSLAHTIAVVRISMVACGGTQRCAAECSGVSCRAQSQTVSVDWPASAGGGLDR